MTLTQDWTALRARPDLELLVAAEREAGKRLVTAGAIGHIWRLPGRRANVGVWRAADATQLHGLLAQLPLWPWLDADVVPLARHELAGE